MGPPSSMPGVYGMGTRLLVERKDAWFSLISLSLVLMLFNSFVLSLLACRLMNDIGVLANLKAGDLADLIRTTTRCWTHCQEGQQGEVLQWVHVKSPWSPQKVDWGSWFLSGLWLAGNWGMLVLMAFQWWKMKYQIAYLFCDSAVFILYSMLSDLKVKSFSSPDSFSSLLYWCMDSMIMISKVQFHVPMTFHHFLMLIWWWYLHTCQLGQSKGGDCEQ